MRTNYFPARNFSAYFPSKSATTKIVLQREGRFRLVLLRNLENKGMVRLAGLEPARLAALPPQSSVSANSTISAAAVNRTAPARFGKGIFKRRGLFLKIEFLGVPGEAVVALDGGAQIAQIRTRRCVGKG